MPSITCSDLSFAWPDGSAVLDGLNFAMGEGRSGLVGRVREEHFAVVRDDWDVEERARATLDRLGLAARFLARPDVLLLDEPTNNLDLASVQQLTTALASYRGAMMVASHDVPFLREAGVTRWLRLERRLTEIDPL